MDTFSQKLPEKFLERLKKLYSPEDLEKVLHAMENKPLPSFRTNTLKITTVELEQSLQKQHFVLEKIPWYNDAFIIKNKSVRELTDTDEYKKGYIYIQNLSSMIPAIILDPKSDETILDMCAAPGSKTTQIAAFMNNQGEIIANDLSRQRLYKLKANLGMNGVTNTTITNYPGQMIWKKYPEFFDKTLVDVPCSMEGRITLSDPDTFEDWSLRKIKVLEAKQKYILRSAISATKVGGIIIYSSCTLAPEENEGIIDWMLKKEADAIVVEKIAIKKLTLNEGIIRWTKNFNPQVKLTARINPQKTMEGFFIAKLRKIKSTIKPHVK